MGSTQYEPFYYRTSPTAVCAGNSFRNVRTAGKEGENDISERRLKETGGYAPYASRFTDGAYIHGVPVNEPRKTQIEYSWSLGTTPDHICVYGTQLPMPNLFSTGHLLMRRLFLFWNKNPYLYRDFISSLNPMLQKVILFLSFLFIPFSHVSVDTMAVPASDFPTPVSELAAGEQLFEEMELGGIVNFIAFRQAVAGYNRIKEKSKPILTLIDFSKPSTEKRFFVFDMEKKQLLYSSVVSHGRNSGELCHFFLQPKRLL